MQTNFFTNPIKNLNRVLAGGGWFALPAAGFIAGLLAVLLRAWRREIFFTAPTFVSQVSWGLLFGVALGTGLLLAALCLLFKSVRPLAWALPGGWLAFAFVLAITAKPSVYFSLGLCLPLYFMLNWAWGAHPVTGEGRVGSVAPRLRMAHTLPITILLFLLMTAALVWVSLLRYRTYNATTYDLGLFGQMFESLRRSGHAWTTLERNQWLTHFGVHCSPFYYLLLPFYLCVPRVETLLVLQAAGVSAGLFAVRAIAKRCFGSSPKAVLAACLLYFLHPAFGYGCIYDFHENKFLAPLLLWAFYFLLRRKMLPLALFAALVLSVKEDAAVYVATLALFLLFGMGGLRRDRQEGAPEESKARRRRIWTALLLLVMSVAWFLTAAAIIRHYGDGIMTGRLRNFFPKDGPQGFSGVLQTFLSNPGFVIHQVFTLEKAEFLLWLFLPLSFAPLLQRRNAAWVLLLPVLAVNLLSNYALQHAMGFQYAYGTAALALAMTIVTLAERSSALRRRVLSFAVCASLLCAAPLVMERAEVYRAQWEVGAQHFRAVDRALAALPPDAEITATSWFPPHLTQRTAALYFYPTYYGSQRVTEYFLCSESDFADIPELEAYLAENYILIREAASLRIYRAIWI